MPFVFPAQITVIDFQSKAPIDAFLVADPTESELRKMEDAWGPYRAAAIGKFSVSDPRRPESAHWDWCRKSASVAPGTARVVTVNVNGEIQGALMVSTQPVRHPTRSSSAASFLYVEYLETAPWNLRDYVGEAMRYATIGSQLLRCAIQLSIDAGCEGRLLLTALEKAEAFYVKRHFHYVGYDWRERLNVYELREQDAQLVLQGR